MLAPADDSPLRFRADLRQFILDYREIQAQLSSDMRQRLNKVYGPFRIEDPPEVRYVSGQALRKLKMEDLPRLRKRSEDQELNFEAEVNLAMKALAAPEEVSA